MCLTTATFKPRPKNTVGITMVDAADAAAAEALVLVDHPGGRVHAVDGALVTEENRVRMLGAWLRQQGQ